jgi:hypothetical protein
MNINNVENLVVLSCSRFVQSARFTLNLVGDIFCRNVLEERQLNGAMHRVPTGFYSMGNAYQLIINQTSYQNSVIILVKNIIISNAILVWKILGRSDSGFELSRSSLPKVRA